MVDHSTPLSQIFREETSGILSTFNALTRFSFGLAMLSGLLTIVISLYNILLGLRRNEIGNCITFSITLSAETLAIFLNCVIGAALTKESEILRDQLYFTEWYNFDLKNRKLFLNFQTAVTQPYVIKGGGIMDLKMDTFSSIMNSAYSFFNIMQTME
uniref:Putative odorant receptor 71a n=1 Tax=Lygus hesperus TaxID=30085 RepID=A0A0A9Y3N8_LYGHE